MMNEKPASFTMACGDFMLFLFSCVYLGAEWFRKLKLPSSENFKSSWWYFFKLDANYVIWEIFQAIVVIIYIKTLKVADNLFLN